MTTAFVVEPQDDGSLAVNWDSETKLEWKAVLSAVKEYIPYGYRVYNPDRKVWIVGSSHQDTLNQIIASFSTDTSEIKDGLEAQIGDEAIANLVGQKLRKLPKSMRQKATWAIKAAVGLIDAPVEYSLSLDAWGAWNEEDGYWWYTTGSYSKHSPSKNDSREIAKAQANLERAIESVPGVLEGLDEKYVRPWKAVFREQMLEKYDYECFVCGAQPHNQKHLHMHRVIPGRDGGEYIENNVVLLCVSCHRKNEGLSWDDIIASREDHVFDASQIPQTDQVEG